MKNHYYFGHVDPWWDHSFKSLDYAYYPIKNIWDEQRWINEGYNKVTLNGALYGMPNPMPDYAQPFLDLFNWSNIGLGFFRMKTLEMFPVHQDHYVSYQKKFNIVDTSVIWRCVVFLEDWKSGHYFEIDGQPRLSWRAGDYVVWNYDVPHFAGNFGVETRYTVQITGSQQ